MMKTIKFYDTCSLLTAGEALFEEGTHFMISSITLEELQHIKDSPNKDPDIKYSARSLLQLFEKFPDLGEIVIHKTEYERIILQYGYSLTNDTKILSDMYFILNNTDNYNFIFVTNDLNLKLIARTILNCPIESVKIDENDYTGYVEIYPGEEELAQFYSDNSKNHYNLKVGQYLIIRDLRTNDIIDIKVWTGTNYRFLKYNNFNSDWFGKIKPYENDPYQKLLCDSLVNNKITMVKGPAGSGKTILSLGFLMSEIEHGNLDKIIIFCNTIATANSAKLGFYPGTRDEKLLDSQIGNLLISKFGGREGVERLMSENKLVLLPMSDIRGYDTTGMRAGVYISEAQNLDRTLIKLALQRIGEDCICIIDGDEKTQVDDIHFSGNNNGMRRVSKIYRGHDIYGEVTLKNIYRSQIAKIAENI